MMISDPFPLNREGGGIYYSAAIVAFSDDSCIMKNTLHLSFCGFRGKHRPAMSIAGSSFYPAYPKTQKIFHCE
jgi:hypothetical protein